MVCVPVYFSSQLLQVAYNVGIFVRSPSIGSQHEKNDIAAMISPGIV